MATRQRNYLQQGIVPLNVFCPDKSVASVTDIALNSAFTFGTSGGCYAWWFQAVDGGNLTDIMVAVASFSGTWGSTDGLINLEIRDGVGASAGIPGSLVASTTLALSTGNALQWVTKSGLSVALTAGKWYCIVVGDADGGATNFVTMRFGGKQAVGGASLVYSYNSTNGFTTASSMTNCAFIAVKVNGVVMSGGLYYTNAAEPSGTLRRGHLLTFEETCELVGFRFFSNDTIPAGSIQVYDSTTAPSGTPLFSHTYVASVGSLAPITQTHYLFPIATSFTFKAGTRYRVVWQPSAAQTTPQLMQTFGNLTADLKTLFGPSPNSNCQHTIEVSGGGSWTDDDTTRSGLGLILAPSTAPTIVG